MSNIANDTPITLKNELSIELKKRAKEEGFNIDYDTPSALFKTLIEALYNKYGQGVVVLIDEYDKPILDRLNDYDIAEANRDVLRGFYGVLKSMNPYLRLTFITGITKFTKTSIFSGLNNLFDITFTRKYSNICGISAEQLEEYFADHMEHLSSLAEFGQYENIHDEIITWYDGYSWDGKTRVINPFSLLSFFSQERFECFWYASGTPKFLVELLKKNPRVYTKLSNLKITELMLDTAELSEISAELLMFQTGYLTVKEILPVKGITVYLLHMPNFEVRDAFNLHVLTAFTENSQSFVKSAQIEIDDALLKGDLTKVLAIFKGLFASIPYQLHIGQEAYYHSIFYAVLNLLNFQIDAEVSVSGGRVDAILELVDFIYVFEFKYVDCAPDASSETKQKLFTDALNDGMRQIKDKGYANRYTGGSKTINLVAFAFLGRDEIGMQMESTTV